MFRPLLAAFALLPGLAWAEEPVTLKVLSFNIWYGGDQVSFAKVIEAIRTSDADIVGLQEPDGKTLQIAALAGYPYADVRRHIISKFPLFDSGVGEATSAKVTPGSDIALPFSGTPGFRLDWIGVHRAGEPSVYNYLGFAYTGARHQGEMTFPADVLYEELTPGDYELRLMFDDHYQTLAVAPFTVAAE